jgi:hypothetical protein
VKNLLRTLRGNRAIQTRTGEESPSYGRIVAALIEDRAGQLEIAPEGELQSEIYSPNKEIGDK